MGIDVIWQDPIIKKTQELRELYASKFNHDADAIFEDIPKRQERSTRKRVAFPARKPNLDDAVAEANLVGLTADTLSRAGLS